MLPLRECLPREGDLVTVMPLSQNPLLVLKVICKAGVPTRINYFDLTERRIRQWTVVRGRMKHYLLSALDK